jgi:hypothetical protein
MATDDEAARKARAEQLRKQIDELKQRNKTPGKPDNSPAPKSPRDLIHDKMQELDENEPRE